MGILGSNNQKIIEDTFGNPIASKILKHKDIVALKKLFHDIPFIYSQRYFYSLAFSRRFPVKILEQWVKQEPENADAHLVYGARLLKLAWKARGFGRGHDISAQQWQEFYALLDQTIEELETAARLKDDDPTPWVYLIMAAVYHSQGAETELRYYNEAGKRDPNNWHAHIHRLTGLSKKYGGSHQLMFDFVKNVQGQSADNNLLNCLVFKAHSEYWKYKSQFEGDEKAAENHANDPAVIAECLAVYESTLASNEYDSFDVLFARINATGLFHVLRQKEPLKTELKNLQGQLEDVHWTWVGTGWELRQAKLLSVLG
ncbi:MAG: hypothetical protein HRT35_06685 [Algicola sp.]|nr:hypothetical protein [Algicola sp.]